VLKTQCITAVEPLPVCPESPGKLAARFFRVARGKHNLHAWTKFTQHTSPVNTRGEDVDGGILTLHAAARTPRPRQSIEPGREGRD
jgi:hypothetical protein